MNKEKFDQELRSVVLAQEETSAPSFNRNKVWRKSTGNRRRKNLAAVIYIAATLLFAVNILWPGVEKEIVKIENNSTNKTSVESVKPSSVENTVIQSYPSVSDIAQKAPAVQEKTNESILGYPALIKSEVVEINPVVQQPVIENSQNSNNQSVSIPPATLQMIASAPSVKEDVKITFKRGKTEAMPQPDLRVSFRKGKLKVDMVPGTPVDSAYYVNIPNPFKLNFKR